MLLSIVIPCLNEQQTVTRVVKQAQLAVVQARKNYKKLGKVEIIVADNGSTDGSVAKIKKQNMAQIVTVPIRGYGAALHWGILSAKGQYVLYADADLSYHFSELPKFLTLIASKKKYDLILGSRFLGSIKEGAMPLLHRYLGTPILTFLIRWIYKIPTTDSNSGMRLVNRHFYQSLNMQNSGMEWASELLIRTAFQQGSYAEVPITLYPDQRQKRPHLIPWVDGWRHLKAIVLLKPSLLYLVTASFLGLAAISFQLEKNLAIFFFLTGVAFIFCTLAAELIKFSIDGQPNILGRLILRLPLVPIIGILMIAGITQSFFWPDQFQTPRMIFIHIILMYSLWVFFIETIKTHLLNKLPIADSPQKK